MVNIVLPVHPILTEAVAPAVPPEASRTDLHRVISVRVFRMIPTKGARGVAQPCFERAAIHRPSVGRQRWPEPAAGSIQTTTINPCVIGQGSQSLRPGGTDLDLLLPIAAVVAGFVALVWGADRFVEGSAATAQNLGVSPLVIGLTIVGFGTSAPELLVSSFAAAAGSEGLAIGNAIGSNTTNCSLVLGAAVLVSPVTIPKEILGRELPILFAIMLGTGVLLYDGTLSRADGFLLLGSLGLLVGWIVWSGVRAGRRDSETADAVSEMSGRMTGAWAAVWLAIGLVVLLVSARLVVWGAASLAGQLGIGELVIGLTVVALGTSLPELAATIVSAVKQEHELALGNIVGSNMFNTLGVLGLPGAICPGPVDETVLGRDYPAMLAVTALVGLLGWKFGLGGRRLGRVSGSALLLIYVAYIAMLADRGLVHLAS